MKLRSKITFLFGLLLGLGTGLFVSPKSGRENREIVRKKLEALHELMGDSDIESKTKKIFGRASKESIKLYKQINEELYKNLSSLHGSLHDIDKQAYFASVEKTLMKFKKMLRGKNAKTVSLRAFLKKQWDEFQKRLNNPDTAKKRGRKQTGKSSTKVKKGET